MGNPEIAIIAETDNYSFWASDEPDGELTYHLELGSVTIHLFREELDELLALLHQAKDHVGDR